MTLNILSNVTGNSNYETDFLQKYLITDTQVLRLSKAFGNSSSATMKLLKTYFSR